MINLYANHEQDVKEKRLLLPKRRINYAFLKYADQIKLYYCNDVKQDAVLAARWLRNEDVSDESISNDLVGAFYLFKNTEGKLFAFANKMIQANSPQDLSSFGLWFGEVAKSPVNDRISNVLENILKHSPQPISLPL